ncbi:MAG: hypothetical protein C4318_07720 [Acidimicrobiia bacterium]
MRKIRRDLSSVLWRTRLQLLVVVVVVFLLGPIPGSLSIASGPAEEPGPLRGVPARTQHTVSEGETLWGIALKNFPGVDPRCAVETIRDANQLGGATIEVGMVLNIPEDVHCRSG